MRSNRKTNKGPSKTDRCHLIKQRAAVARRITRLTTEIKGLKSQLAELKKLIRATTEWSNPQTESPLKNKQQIKGASAKIVKCKEEMTEQEDEAPLRARSLSSASAQSVLEVPYEQVEEATRELYYDAESGRNSSSERSERLQNRRRGSNSNARDEMRQNSRGFGPMNQRRPR